MVGRGDSIDKGFEEGVWVVRFRNSKEFNMIWVDGLRNRVGGDEIGVVSGIGFCRGFEGGF